MDVKAFNFAFGKLQELESPARTEEAERFMKRFDFYYFASLCVYNHWDFKRTIKLHIPFDFARTVEPPGTEKAQYQEITRRFGRANSNMFDAGKEFYELLRVNQLMQAAALAARQAKELAELAKRDPLAAKMRAGKKGGKNPNGPVNPFAGLPNPNETDCLEFAKLKFGETAGVFFMPSPSKPTADMPLLSYPGVESQPSRRKLALENQASALKKGGDYATSKGTNRKSMLFGNTNNPVGEQQKVYFGPPVPRPAHNKADEEQLLQQSLMNSSIKPSTALGSKLLLSAGPVRLNAGPAASGAPNSSAMNGGAFKLLSLNGVLTQAGKEMQAAKAALAEATEQGGQGNGNGALKKQASVAPPASATGSGSKGFSRAATSEAETEASDQQKKKGPKLPSLQLGPLQEPMPAHTSPRMNRVGEHSSRWFQPGETMAAVHKAREYDENYYDARMQDAYLLKRTTVTRKMKNALLKKPDRIQRAIDQFEELPKLIEVSRQSTFLSEFYGFFRTPNEIISFAAFEPARDLALWLKLHRREVRDLGIPRLEWAEISTWMCQVTHGLAWLHYNGLTHRNVKPSNVFLERVAETKDKESYKLKLGDWGSCIFRYYGDTINTNDMLNWAPEVIMGEAVTQRTDMWGLGHILWQLCNLRPAFRWPENARKGSQEKQNAYLEALCTFGSDVPDLKPEKFPQRYIKAHPLLKNLYAKEGRARCTCGDLLASPDSALRFQAETVEDSCGWRRKHPSMLFVNPDKEVRFLPDGEPPLWVPEPLPPQPWHVLPPNLCEALSVASLATRKKKLFRRAKFFAKTKIMMNKNKDDKANMDFGAGGASSSDEEQAEAEKRKKSLASGESTQEVVVVRKDPDPEKVIRSGSDQMFAKIERLKARSAMGRVGLKGAKAASKGNKGGGNKLNMRGAASVLKNRAQYTTFQDLYDAELSPRARSAKSPRNKALEAELAKAGTTIEEFAKKMMEMAASGELVLEEEEEQLVAELVEVGNALAAGEIDVPESMVDPETLPGEQDPMIKDDGDDAPAVAEDGEDETIKVVVEVEGAEDENKEKVKEAGRHGRDKNDAKDVVEDPAVGKTADATGADGEAAGPTTGDGNEEAAVATGDLQENPEAAQADATTQAIPEDATAEAVSLSSPEELQPTDHHATSSSKAIKKKTSINKEAKQALMNPVFLQPVIKTGGNFDVNAIRRGDKKVEAKERT
ncbi:unnamed protein product [Amoebophrya sp. A25]|nr:unnamed protein product [Amoebophrya sp. A25]|eukprot:GSA25T00016338001.1